jgi:hypothetical protein
MSAMTRLFEVHLSKRATTCEEKHWQRCSVTVYACRAGADSKIRIDLEFQRFYHMVLRNRYNSLLGGADCRTVLQRRYTVGRQYAQNYFCHPYPYMKSGNIIQCEHTNAAVRIIPATVYGIIHVNLKRYVF